MVDFKKLNTSEARERRKRDQEENENRIKLIQSWIDAVNERGQGLTDWEEHFMESITSHFRLYETMSMKQQEALERIYAEKTK